MMLIRSLATAAVVAVGLFALTPAWSQGMTPEQQQLSGLIGSPSFRAFLQEAVAGNEAAVFKAKCAEPKVTRVLGFLIVTPPNITQRGIEAGAWVTHVEVDRCGTTASRRILARVEGGINSLTSTGVLPGDFRGDLKLETDVIRTAVIALMGTAGCRDIAQFGVSDIKALTPVTAAGWSETWFAEAYGKPIIAVVDYKRDATGVGFNVHDVKVQ